MSHPDPIVIEAHDHRQAVTVKTCIFGEGDAGKAGVGFSGVELEIERDNLQLSVQADPQGDYKDFPPTVTFEWQHDRLLVRFLEPGNSDVTATAVLSPAGTWSIEKGGE